MAKNVKKLNLFFIIENTGAILVSKKSGPLKL